MRRKKNPNLELFKTKKEKRKKLKPMPKLKKLAEKYFHKYICLRDKYTCFTCGKVGNQAGHFRHSKLDFDEINLNCQCAFCNCYAHGNLGIYAVKLIKKYGQEVVDDLIARSYKPKKYTRDELDEYLRIYKLKVKEYEN